MLVLQGQPSAHLKLNCLAGRRDEGEPEQPRRPATLESIVNGPNTIVVSGAGAVELMDELEDCEKTNAR
eukprot:11456220-Heterocapsa_arctica.AAC.1